MAATEQPLTRADFDRCCWEEAIAGAAKKDCFEYSRLFLQRVRQAKDAGDATAEAVFTVLFVATDVGLRAGDAEPFAPRFVGGATRGSDPWDLSREQCRVLAELALGVSDPEMRARLCDIAWVTLRDHRLAKAGVDAYLASARQWEDPVNWVHCADRITRALGLARSLGGGGRDEFDRAVAYVEDLLARLDAGDPLYLSARLMELLQQYRRGDAAAYAGLAERAARRAEGEGGSALERAGHYWQLAAGWHGMAGDAARREAARIQAAETFVTRAAEAADKPRENVPHLNAASFLERAHHALRKIGTPAASRRAEAVYLQLTEHQKHSVHELASFNHTLDVTDLAKTVEAEVSGKSLPDALVRLAALVRPASVGRLRDQVRAQLGRDPLMALFSTATLSNTGKVVATRPHFESSPEGAERAVVAEMHRAAVLQQRVAAYGVVMPAVVKIDAEHPVREQDFFQVAATSAFVPPGREMTFAKGLYAGFRRDLSTATHLLIPQIENSIRVHLEARGEITSGFDRQNRQNEYDLNTTLYMDALRQVFDEDTIFTLRGVLVDHHGSNLRNMMAHGLLGDLELESDVALFLWAFTLRLCLTTPHPAAQLGEPGGSPPGTAVESPHRVPQT